MSKLSLSGKSVTLWAALTLANLILPLAPALSETPYIRPDVRPEDHTFVQIYENYLPKIWRYGGEFNNDNNNWQVRMPTLQLTPIPTDVTPSKRAKLPSVDPPSHDQKLVARPNTFLIATNSCRPGVDPLGRFGILTLRGTMYSMESPTRIHLLRGRMLVASDDGRFQVRTRTAAIKLEAKAAAIIEATPSGITRVYCLSSYDINKPGTLVWFAKNVTDAPEAPAELNKLETAEAPPAPASDKEKATDKMPMVPLTPGQELVVTNNDASAHELIPVDTVARRPLKNAEAANLPEHVKIAEFSLAQMADYDALINCGRLRRGSLSKVAYLLREVFDRVVAFSVEQKDFPSMADTNFTNNLMRQVQEMADAGPANVLAQMAASAKSGSLTGGSTDDDGDTATPKTTSQADPVPPKPGAHFAGKPGVCNGYKEAFCGADTYAFASTDAIFHRQQNVITLEKGSLVCSTKRPYRFICGAKEVYMCNGAMGVINFDGTTLKVINMGDTKRDSMHLFVGGQTFAILPSREIIISANPPSLSDIFDPFQVGHRSTTSRYVEKVGWFTNSEVMLSDLVVHHQLVRSCHHNTRSRNAQALSELLIKNAAALAILHVNSNVNPFERGLPFDPNKQILRMATRCNSCLQ